MNKRIITFLMLIFIICELNTAFAQKEDRSDEWWSKITVDRSVQIYVDPSYVYKPAPQVSREYILKRGKSTVNPNFRPFPTVNSTQSEMSVDVHPLNSNIVFGSANATPWPVNGIYGTSGYITTDGGSNWSGFDNPPFGANSGDPAVVIGTNGNFYLGFIDGGANDGGQGIAVSTNDGATWNKYVVGNAPAGFFDLLDKNHLYIDKKVGSPYENRVYAAWTAFVTGSPNDVNLEFRYSTNNGQTWSNIKNISGALNSYLSQGVNLNTGPNGEVYATWAIYSAAPVTDGEDGIGFNMSTDGGETWGTPKKIYNQTNFGIRGTLTSKASIRVSSFPSMTVDRSGGANDGNIYVFWPQKGVAPAGSSPDIVMIKSTDGGASWSAPVRVNDDAIANGKDQYYPWAAVDQSTGALYAVWYDSRNVANDSAEVFIGRSMDGGDSFENIKVSDAVFKPKPISGLASGYQGDYIGIAAHNNFVYPFWSDDRTGNYQGWMAIASFGPSIFHNPLENTEDLSGPYMVSAEIESSILLDSNRIYLHWGKNGSIIDSVLMVNSGGNTYLANIPGDGNPAVFNYYISAEDTSGGVSKFPAGAPASYLSFEASTDLVPPSITHSIIPDQYRELWPAVVNAEVTDNIGVDSVWVEYKINTSGSINIFMLAMTSENNYSGLFNIDTTQIALGDTMYYRISAKDSSAAENLGYDPSENSFNSFVFIPDTENPAIIHTPLRDQPILRWPAMVKALVSDNLGVSTVEVEYSVNNGSIIGSFPLIYLADSIWQGAFDIDTNVVSVGDTVEYRLKAIDNSTSANISYDPDSSYNGFKIINTKGVVLIVNDDISLALRASDDKAGLGDLSTPVGASVEIFSTTLINAGFVADTISFSALDTTILYDYDIVILSSGTRETEMFDDLAKRTAIVNYTLSGGKTLIEGGEIGWKYRYSSPTSDKDPNFRRNVLHDSTWISDNSNGDLILRIPGHTFWNEPNTITGPIDITNSEGTGFGARDVVRTLPKAGVIKLAGWINGSTSYPDSAGIIAYYQGGDSTMLRNIFFTFAISQFTDQSIAEDLIENAAQSLINSELEIPVELISFNALVDKNSVQLNWTTATETNNYGFEIQRKKSAEKFESIGFKQGNGTIAEYVSYNYEDENLVEGSYSYRLKQIDFDGTSSYSSEISVLISAPISFSLEQNYPNPFNPATSIKYSIPKDGFVNLNIYNILGEKAASLVSENMKAGSYTVTFNASGLASGIYFYRLESGDNLSIKKMILLK